MDMNLVTALVAVVSIIWLIIYRIMANDKKSAYEEAIKELKSDLKNRVKKISDIQKISIKGWNYTGDFWTHPDIPNSSFSITEAIEREEIIEKIKKYKINTGDQNDIRFLMTESEGNEIKTELWKGE